MANGSGVVYLATAATVPDTLEPAHSTHKASKPQAVYLTRTELGQILTVYGRNVAAGEWRDYGIATLKDEAIFAVYRRTSEAPLYSIIKTPALRSKQGMWRIVSMSGQILKRGHDLETLLTFFQSK